MKTDQVRNLGFDVWTRDARKLRNLGIDVWTKDARKLRTRLKRLKSTISVEDGGMYREGPEYSQIHITTIMTQDELDHWLWATKHGCGCVGVFKR